MLPEDRANEEITNGFIQSSKVNYSAIQIERCAGGWTKVLQNFAEVHVLDMRQFSNSWMVLLIDFDNNPTRFDHVKKQIPEDLNDRVFVLGVLSEPEKLRRDLKTDFEGIGEALAKDCSDNTNTLWRHELLKHNQTELERMMVSVKPFLFN